MNQNRESLYTTIDTCLEALAKAEKERDAAKSDYRAMRAAWDEATTQRDRLTHELSEAKSIIAGMRSHD